jgi:hypothetical protein
MSFSRKFVKRAKKTKAKMWKKKGRKEKEKGKI